MARRNRSNSGQSATDLLNFRFATAAPSQPTNGSSNNSSSNGNAGGRSHRNDRRQGNKKQQYNRSAQDRASARRKAKSAMFYLHSSADHAFVLTRKGVGKLAHQKSYSFSGSDETVSWDSVRLVRHMVSMQQGSSLHDSGTQICPICLDDMTCARITKCGHCFCLPCILRHNQSSHANNPYQHVKCPCCGLPFDTSDLRPVLLETSTAKSVQKQIKLVKLHRNRDCAVPYLPLEGEPMHSNVHSAPSMADRDAKYSRFNYLDPQFYFAHLTENQQELQKEAKALSVGNANYFPAELTFITLALEMVAKEQFRAQSEHEDEVSLLTRFSQPTAGIYQPQPEFLLSRMHAINNNNSPVAKDTRSTSPESDSTMQRPFDQADGVDAGRRSTELDESERVEDTQPDDLQHDRQTGGNLCSSKQKIKSTMYLDEHAVQLYQSEDGQLVFLNGFNMSCLLFDYSKHPPRDSHANIVLPPLPDAIEGTVLEMETIHLTPEVRKRMPFVSHIPLYTDIILVELDLNHIMSSEAKLNFKKEIVKRRKKRQAKKGAEKKADRSAKMQEEALIEERKARQQIIDPNDDFFQTLELSDLESALIFDTSSPTSSEMPALSTTPTQSQFAVAAAAPGSKNFSQAARGMVVTETETEFPSLGSSPQSAAFASVSQNRNQGIGWGNRTQAQPTQKVAAKPTYQIPSGGKKKKGGKKLVLFTTGGQRGGY